MFFLEGQSNEIKYSFCSSFYAFTILYVQYLFLFSAKVGKIFFSPKDFFYPARDVLHCGDGTERDLYILVVDAVACAGVRAAAHVAHAVPHRRVQQEVDEGADGVVAQLEQQGDRAQVKLERERIFLILRCT